MDRGTPPAELIAQAVEPAKGADVPIVFAGPPGRYGSEGFDRENIKMPVGHLRLIGAVADASPNTAVVPLCGAPVECPDLVRAIRYMSLPGQVGGPGLLHILRHPDGAQTGADACWPSRFRTSESGKPLPLQQAAPGKH